MQPAQEPRPTATFLILDTLCRLLIPFAVGSAAVFIMVLVGGIVGKEQTQDVSSVNSALDMILRGLIGVSAVGIAGSLLVLGYVWTARTVALSTILTRGRRQLEAHLVCPDPRGSLPKDPSAGAVAATVSLLIFAAFMGLFFLTQLLSGSADGDPIYPLGALGSLILLGAGVAVLFGISRLKKWWRTRRLPSLNAFRSKQKPPDERRRSRLQVIEMILIGAGFVIFFLGVFIRQPGRWRSMRHYNAVGELIIRDLVLVGSILMALGMVIVVVRSIARLIVQVSQLFSAATPGTNVTDDGPVDRLLSYVTGVITIIVEALLAVSFVAGPRYPILERWRMVASSWWTSALIMGLIVIILTFAASWSGTWMRNRLRRGA